MNARPSRLSFSVFPQSQWAPKAAYQVAYVGLEDPVNWQKSVERFNKVAADYPGTAHAQTAREYYKALTDPQNALHLELLTLLYRNAARNPRAYPLYAHFICGRYARLHAKRPTLQWLAQDKSLADSDKASIGRDLAEMLFKASREDLCTATCEWVAATYPQEAEPCAFVLGLVGDIDMKIHRNYAAAEKNYRRIIASYADSLNAAEGLCELGARFFADDDLAKANGLLGEVRQRWPASKWASNAFQILQDPRMTARFGQPRILSAAKTSSPGLAGWFRGILGKDKAPGATATADKPHSGARERLNCGVYAFARVCERLGIACNDEDARKECLTNADGSASVYEISSALQKKGLSTQAFEMGLQQLRAMAKENESQAVMLHFRNHFVVLESISDKGVILSDNLRGSPSHEFRPPALLLGRLYSAGGEAAEGQGRCRRIGQTRLLHQGRHSRDAGIASPVYCRN